MDHLTAYATHQLETVPSVHYHLGDEQFVGSLLHYNISFTSSTRTQILRVSSTLGMT